MEINATRGLGALKTKVKFDLEKAVEERKSLGLTVPEDFRVGIRYYNDTNTAACATMDNNMPYLGINVLSSVYKNYKGKLDKDISFLMNYFDNSRELFINTDESIILDMMFHPVNVISELENSFRKKEFENLKKRSEMHGRKYTSYKKEAIDSAHDARKLLRVLNPVIKDKFSKTRLSASGIRHELDHLDMFSSKICKRFYDNIGLEKKADDKFKNDKKSSNEYAKIAKKTLKSRSEDYLLMEIKGLFFDNVPFNAWNRVDYEDVKRKVYGRFEFNYIEGALVESIVESLIKMHSPDLKFTVDTANYIRMVMLGSSFLNLHADRYGAERTKINYTIANKIMYEEIPEWKKIFAKNAEEATDAVGCAFKQDHSRFNKANKNAETFNQYIHILKSKK